MTIGDSNKAMYDLFGITEWSEKRDILSTDEALEVLSSLRNGQKSELTELVRRPFPSFAKSYFENFFCESRWTKDPAFGFKMYYLSPYSRKLFTEMIRNPQKKIKLIVKELGLAPSKTKDLKSDIYNILNAPYEQITFLASSQRRHYYIKKYLYLTRYIDLEMARKLSLSIVPFFEADGTDGFEFDRKMNMLNPAIKKAFSLYLGLEGERMYSQSEIAKKAGLPENPICDLLKYLLANFGHPTGQFAHAIGYSKDSQKPGEYIEYYNKKFSDLDVNLEITFLLNNLPDEISQVLSQFSRSEARIYIASKYMYMTKERLARALHLSELEAQKYLKETI